MSNAGVVSLHPLQQGKIILRAFFAALLACVVLYLIAASTRKQGTFIKTLRNQI